jgi:N-methylhydantoinase A/oxoprolinase/acetone carboxylase beta subunit
LRDVQVNGSSPVRVGVDTGGTFTDFVIWKDGRLFNRKILSTPRDPSEAIWAGIGEFLDGPGRIVVIHGTTVATNALLEKKGGRIALVTTAGFEDVLAIGRQTRSELYSLSGEDRFVLVPAGLRLGLRERVLAGGKVEASPSPRAVRDLVERIREAGVEAVAVCFLHSYANPAHEAAVAAALRRAGFLVSASSEVLPEYREYERTSTTAVNACLMPVMDRYLGELEKKLGRADLRIMQSNEGYISPARARREPIRTALSGPAGGAVAAARLAWLAGFRNVVSFDMGGTSTDVSLIDGRIRRTQEGWIGDFPIRIPIIDIHSVGAGGGSIAYADRGGALRVGPTSAGADPGPACYGKGDLPTVTDADLVLGRICPEFFLGGRMKIEPRRSAAAIGRLAAKIGKSTRETAEGMVAVANANMEKAIRVISVERGFDPRRFSLFSFGGAGGMHAVEMSGHLGMPHVLVPMNAGVLSAMGLLLADFVKDYSRTLLKKAAELTSPQIEAAFRGLESACLRDLRSEGFRPEAISLLRSMDLRYYGQSYEITIPYRRASGTKPRFLDDFHKAHEKLYSYRHDGSPVEIVNLRIKAVVAAEKIPIRAEKEGRGDPRGAVFGTQSMICGGRTWKGAVYDRSKLGPGMRISGPALIMAPESTTFLPPGYSAKVDRYRNLVIAKGGRP